MSVPAITLGFTAISLGVSRSRSRIQGLFCSLNPCDRLSGCKEAGGWRVFVAEIGHLYMKNRGNF